MNLTENAGSTPIVSVVITTKNRPTLLPRAVKSVLGQTWRDLELIVIDDGSDVPVTLDTADARARVIRNDVSKGVAEARNVGFRSSAGQFLCMLDDDDWYLPNKLEEQVRFLTENSGIDLVFSRVRVRDAAGLERAFIPDGHVHTPVINLNAYNVIHPSSALFRRRVFEKVQFEPRLKKYEDTLFFNRVCFACSTAFLPLDVAVWMQDGRPDQLSRLMYECNFVNFRCVCEGLADILKENRGARHRYYGRLAYQAARLGRLAESLRVAFKAI